MPRRTLEEQRAYNRARQAKHRAKIGKEACNEQARALYHQYDDDPEQREVEQEKRRIRGRRWYSNHADEKIAKVMAYDAERAKDPVLAEIDRKAGSKRAKDWAQRNPEKQEAAAANWKKAHPEQVKAARRKRYAANPQKYLAYTAKYNALKKGSTQSTLTPEQWAIIKAVCRNSCVYCGKKLPALTKDHLTPVSGGGPDTMQNVLPACRSCNAKKGTGKVLRPVQPFLL